LVVLVVQVAVAVDTILAALLVQVVQVILLQPLHHKVIMVEMEVVQYHLELVKVAVAVEHLR
jgi:hypothetical protein